MKILVRAFVVALALTGAVASAHTTSNNTASASSVLTKSSALPIPTCPPGTSDCGISNW